MLASPPARCSATVIAFWDSSGVVAWARLLLRIYQRTINRRPADQAPFSVRLTRRSEVERAGQVDDKRPMLIHAPRRSHLAERRRYVQMDRYRPTTLETSSGIAPITRNRASGFELIVIKLLSRRSGTWDAAIIM